MDNVNLAAAPAAAAAAPAPAAAAAAAPDPALAPVPAPDPALAPAPAPALTPKAIVDQFLNGAPLPELHSTGNMESDTEPFAWLTEAARVVSFKYLKKELDSDTLLYSSAINQRKRLSRNKHNAGAADRGSRKSERGTRTGEKKAGWVDRAKGTDGIVYTVWFSDGEESNAKKGRLTYVIAAGSQVTGRSLLVAAAQWFARGDYGQVVELLSLL